MGLIETNTHSIILNSLVLKDDELMEVLRGLQNEYKTIPSICNGVISNRNKHCRKC